jgi:hypothetical protein
VTTRLSVDGPSALAALVIVLGVALLAGCGGDGGTGPDDHNAPGDTIYVDPGYTGNETGSRSRPFNTIAEALAIAEDGNTIALAPGAYDEGGDVLVTSAVTVEGAGADLTVVDGGFAVVVESDDTPVVVAGLSCTSVHTYVDTTSVSRAPIVIRDCHLPAVFDSLGTVEAPHSYTLDGCTIDGDVVLVYASALGRRLVRGCVIGGGARLAMACGRTAQIIEGCDIGGGVSITVVSGDTCRIEDTDVGSDVDLAGVSVHALIADGNTIGGSLRMASVSSKSEIAIYNAVHGDSLNVKAVSDSLCRIANNVMNGGGILAQSRLFKDLAIVDNELTAGGIRLAARSAHGSVSANSVSRTDAAPGIAVSGVVAPGVSSNEVNIPYAPPSGVPVDEDSTAVSAIRVIGVSVGEIADNTVSGGAYGIQCVSTACDGVLRNKVTDSHVGMGVACLSVQVEGNQVLRCVGDGMLLAGPYGEPTPTIRLKANDIVGNGGAGVRILDYALLGTGSDSDGGNVLVGNDDYDLFVEAAAADNDTIPARYNTWDHTDPHEVSDFDIYDGVDDPLRSIVSFEPIAPSRGR